MNDGPPDIVLRNLQRGRRLGLPCGQDVARVLGIKPLEGCDPLWSYVLRETDAYASCGHLGEVGSTIVGEVLFGLLRGDDHAFCNQDPRWRPWHEPVTKRLLPDVMDRQEFDFRDFLRMAGMPMTAEQVKAQNGPGGDAEAGELQD